MKKTRIGLRFIPFILGLALLIAGFIMKQYAYVFLSCFFLIGFPVIFFIVKYFETKRGIIIEAILIFVLISSMITFGFLARGTLKPLLIQTEWNMYQIDNPGYILPNGLDQADVNKDGFMDYLTNYEWDGKIRIELHPGIDGVKERWDSFTIGSVSNAESAAFGDFDSDGYIDVAVAHGEELAANSGVFIIWNPDNYQLMWLSEHWARSPDIPGTIDGGHYHFIKCRDISGDGIDDIIVGGRGKNPNAGLKWIETPRNGDIHNMSSWNVYDIDSNLESGHGFEFCDFDLDNDEDIVLCNSDWDTKDEEEKVIIYENPGNESVYFRTNWTKHIIYQGSEFYSKEQVTCADLNNDSYKEIAMQTINHIYIFENPSNLSEPWNLIKIPKAEITQWRARTIKIGDINQDGKMDIVGMLIHKDGYLGTDKGAVFWMECEGSNLLEDNWTTHIIKWGGGFIGLGRYNGEKWDQCIFEDVDLDGDLDIVANCEEYNTLGFVFLAVVWFENPLF